VQTSGNRSAENALQAADLFESAAARRPDDPSIRLHLSLAYLATGDRKRAYVEARKAADLDPDSPTAQKILERLQPAGDTEEEVRPVRSNGGSL
jgi:Tfp pilus assembly protein PilF